MQPPSVPGLTAPQDIIPNSEGVLLGQGGGGGGAAGPKGGGSCLPESDDNFIFFEKGKKVAEGLEGKEQKKTFGL